MMGGKQNSVTYKTTNDSYHIIFAGAKISNRIVLGEMVAGVN